MYNKLPVARTPYRDPREINIRPIF